MIQNNIIRYEICFTEKAIKQLKKVGINQKDFRELLLSRFFVKGKIHKLETHLDFPNNFSTRVVLYSLFINKSLRAIFTNDVDDIHNLHLICVYAVCNHDDYKKTIDHVLSSIMSENK